MSQELLQRWVIGAGGFIGEVSLKSLAAEDLPKAREGVPCVELTDFHVHPLRRGNGWGVRLLDQALQYASRRGWDVLLRVRSYGKGDGPDDDALRRIYHRRGFRRVSRQHPSTLVWRCAAGLQRSKDCA